MQNKRLYRDIGPDKVIGGVCAGLAKYFEVDPTIVRLVFVLLVIFGTSGVLLYVILWILMPPQPAGQPQVIDASSPPQQ